MGGRFLPGCVPPRDGDRTSEDWGSDVGESVGVVGTPTAALAAAGAAAAAAVPLAAEGSALRLKRRGGPKTFRAHPPGGGKTPAACPLRLFLLAQTLDLSSDWGLEQSKLSRRLVREEAGGGLAGGGERHQIDV